MVIEKNREHAKKLYLCFIDYIQQGVRHGRPQHPLEKHECHGLPAAHCPSTEGDVRGAESSSQYFLQPDRWVQVRPGSETGMHLVPTSI